MIRTIACLVVVGFFFSTINVFAENSSKETLAVSAAEKWLVAVDGGKYAESWKEAAELLRNKDGIWRVSGYYIK